MCKSFQNYLNQYRLILLHRLKLVDREQHKIYHACVYKDKNYLHIHPRNNLRCIKFHNVHDHSVPRMKFILRRCKSCPQLQQLIYEEIFLTNNDPKISFHFFFNITKCSIHGKLPYHMDTFPVLNH